MPTSPRESGVVLIVELEEGLALWLSVDGRVVSGHSYKELFEPAYGWEIYE